MNPRHEAFLHGGDYNPEQWLDKPEILVKDIELLKEAGCNTVTLGVFSWSSLEPEEGVYHFEWLEDIIDKLYRNGIRTILATPSGARPKWLSDKYEEVLRVDARRVRALFGKRHNHCYTSPVYREKIGIVNKELSRRFANHPAIIMWHLSNELSGDCHCSLCQEAFRNWLKDRYKTIGELNKRWNTAFWSHTYLSFDQVESPSPIGETWLHGLNLDWKRFVTDQTIDFVKYEKEAVLSYNPNMPVTVNMMYYFVGLNYFKFKDIIDVASWDSYPTWHKDNDVVTGMDNAMFHDIQRSILNKPFYLMESCPTSTNWQKTSKLKRPGMLELASLQAIAHGSDSVLYFQIRQSVGASEKFHGAVIDHSGRNDTRVFKEIKSVGADLEKLKEILSAETEAEVAIVYDWENRWAMEDAQGPRQIGVNYKESVQKFYEAFYKLGMNVDFVDMECDINKYKVLAVPMLYMFREGFESKTRNFVEKGGTLIMTYWSGVVDNNDRAYLGGTPYGLIEVLGLRFEEIDGLYENDSNEMVPVMGNSLQMDKKYCCTKLCELVKTEGAEVLMAYGTDFYEGRPVLTRNKYRNGEAYYVCSDGEQEFFDELCKKVADDKKLYKSLKYDIPYGVAVSERIKDGTKYIFIQNYNNYEVTMDVTGENVMFGNTEGRISAYGTIIIKR
ncbi:MAG: bglY [Anaerocolumna sp.]|nr:bglY [Anaerocolumna sp.]